MLWCACQHVMRAGRQGPGPCGSVSVMVQTVIFASDRGYSYVSTTHFKKNFTYIVCSFQANDGNWPTLKQNSSSSGKPTPTASVDRKGSSVEGPLKQGTVSIQPVPLSALGATEKLVGRLSLSL